MADTTPDEHPTEPVKENAGSDSVGVEVANSPGAGSAEAAAADSAGAGAEGTAPENADHEPAGPEGVAAVGSRTASSADAGPADTSPDPQPHDETGPEGVPSPDAGTDSQDRPVGIVGGTVPAWWTWVGKRRNAVLLVAGVLVVALAATIVTVSLVTPGPKDVVRDYLDAIRSGDTDAALAIAGEPEDDGRLRILSSDALAGEWTFDSIVERQRIEDEVDVDVTLRAGDVAQQGRFHLVDGDDGWKMESPFVKVDFISAGLDTVELGGVREPATVDATQNVVSLLVFPGVYEVYPSMADKVVFDPPLFVAAPFESDETTLRVEPSFSLTDAGVADVQRKIDAIVDECATVPDVDPSGCPFSAAEDSTVRGLDEIADVAWTVVQRPVAHVVATNGVLAPVVRKPGTVKVTGTGVPYEAPRTSFSLTCEFGVENIAVAMDGDGFAVARVNGDRYRAALSTECF